MVKTEPSPFPLEERAVHRHTILPTPKRVPVKGLAWICFSNSKLLELDKRLIIPGIFLTEEQQQIT
jgi:hypothetical protein